jgi:hypothetical protein
MANTGSSGGSVKRDDVEVYWSLIESTKDRYPGFVDNLDQQNLEQRKSGRAAVLEFREGAKADITDFGDSDDALDKYLDDFALRSLKENATVKHHRLFLLEDLARNKVQSLGARLRIPPVFFALHWIDPSEAHFSVDQDFLSHKRSKYFRCRVPQLHSVVPDKPGYYQLGLYEPLNINVQRYLQLLDKDRNFELSHHQISFWSMNTSKGWTCEQYTKNDLMLDQHKANMTLLSCASG